MNKSPAFQFYPNDWLSSPKIMLMTPAQEGAYIRLLAIAWMNDDCGLPSDLDQLARLGRIDRDAIGLVIECFFLEGNRYYNERLLEEREKQENWKKKSSVAGKKGAKSRWESQKKKHRVGHKMVITKPQPNDDSSSSFSSSNINTSNEVLQDEPEQSYGNPEINKMIIALKGKIGIDAFADSSIERNIAKHCVTLMAKIGVSEFARRLDTILSDSFKRKNCNRIKYVYNEIKAFMEPSTADSKIAFIS